MAAQAPARKWVGKSIRRVEDPRFLLGRGGYVDDIVLPGMVHAAVLRSPLPHARIKSIDVSKARALPGVLAVVTGKEVTQLTNPMPDFGPDPSKHTWWVLAVDKVRYVGEPVAAVVATDRYIAEDACELIEVEYEPLPPVVDPEEAMKPGAPLVHEALGSNIAYSRTFVFGDVDRDFAEAEVIVRDRLRWNRSGAQPLETVGAVAQYNPATGMMTIYCNSVTFTYLLFLVANTLKIPSNKLDMVPCPAGGSFGSKFWAVRVPILAGMLAKLVGRPVKFIEDRLDNIFTSDHHGSDRLYEVEMAAMRDGTLRSMRIKVIDDYGAYIQFGVGTHGNSLAQVVGPYKIKSLSYELYAVLTNKCQQGAYRGFGSEVTNWMVERMVDLVARQLNLDPAEIRRKNFIQPHEFPYFIPTGNMYDSGNYPAVLEKALELADYAGLREMQRRARAEGRYVGIGLITAQERSVFSATEFWFWFDQPTGITSTPESVTLSVDPAGNITATLYSQAFWGNSPETMVAQLVAEEFDIDPVQVTVVYSGTARALPATGPGGSRFTVMVAGAIQGAARRIKEKMLKIASHKLEIAPEDLEFAEGKIRVRGAPEKFMTLQDVATLAYLYRLDLPPDVESGLEADFVFDHPYTTKPAPDRKNLGVFYPFVGHACHIAAVEVDIETGQHKFLKYVAVHDAGTLVNPRSLAGQVIGGVAQGLGTALYEQYVYGPDGQLLTGSYMDYLIPTSMEVPRIEVGHHETPSPFTPHGIKGGGEGGRMMTPAVVAAAIEDALAPLGVRVNEVPITPEKILRWVDEARRRTG